MYVYCGRMDLWTYCSLSSLTHIYGSLSRECTYCRNNLYFLSVADLPFLEVGGCRCPPLSSLRAVKCEGPPSHHLSFLIDCVTPVSVIYCLISLHQCSVLIECVRMTVCVCQNGVLCV